MTIADYIANLVIDAYRAGYRVRMMPHDRYQLDMPSPLCNTQGMPNAHQPLTAREEAQLDSYLDRVHGNAPHQAHADEQHADRMAHDFEYAQQEHVHDAHSAREAHASQAHLGFDREGHPVDEGARVRLVGTFDDPFTAPFSEGTVERVNQYGEAEVLGTFEGMEGFDFWPLDEVQVVSS